MPRRVDNVDLVVFPKTSRRRGGDGDAALLLLHHPVHRRRAIMHLADLVNLAAVVENTLGGGRLTRVDVCHQPDVAHILLWLASLAHIAAPLSLLKSFVCYSSMISELTQQQKRNLLVGGKFELHQR